MTPNVEALGRLFAAINRNDMQAIIEDFDPMIVGVEPEGFPTAGTYRGIPEVQEHVRKGRGTWAEGTCEPEQFFVNGDKVVVYLHARVRMHAGTDGLEGASPMALYFAKARLRSTVASASEWTR